MAEWRGLSDVQMRSVLLPGITAVSHASAANQLRNSSDQMAEQAEVARDLLGWLLHADASARPSSMSQVRAHRFLRPQSGVLCKYARCVTLHFDEVDVDMDSILGRGAGGTVFRGRSASGCVCSCADDWQPFVLCGRALQRRHSAPAAFAPACAALTRTSHVGKGTRGRWWR